MILFTPLMIPDLEPSRCTYEGWVSLKSRHFLCFHIFYCASRFYSSMVVRWSFIGCFTKTLANVIYVGFECNNASIISDIVFHFLSLVMYLFFSLFQFAHFLLPLLRIFVDAMDVQMYDEQRQSGYCYLSLTQVFISAIAWLLYACVTLYRRPAFKNLLNKFLRTQLVYHYFLNAIWRPKSYLVTY